MTTIREQALKAIETILRETFSGCEVARNREVRSRVSIGGDVILFDGEETDRVTEMSPPYYVITWAAEIQILVQMPDRADRESNLDNLLVALDGSFPSDNPVNLDGLVHHIIPRGVDLLDEPVENAEDIRAATISLEFEYGTSSSLG